MSPVGRRVAAAITMIALSLGGCETVPPAGEVVEDRPASSTVNPRTDETGTDQPREERERREVAIRTDVTFGTTFFAAPEERSSEERLGPLTLVVNESDPLRTSVSVRNDGSEPVSGVVLTDAVQVTGLTMSEAATETASETETASGGGESVQEPVAEITEVVDQGTCTRDSAVNSATFTCEVGTLDPGATATLTVAIGGVGTDATGTVVHDTRVAAFLP